MIDSRVFDDTEISPTYSCCLVFSWPVRGLASNSLKPMMLVSGVRSS